MSSAKKLLLRVILLSVSVLATLAIAELALQLRHRRGSDPEWYNLLHRRSSIDGLAYELVPNSQKLHYDVPVQINSLGLRDDEPQAAEDGSLMRIAVVGDSYTFGFGVPGEQTYANVLERLLNKAAGEPRFDVLNFGVGGYSTRDEALVLRHRVMEWNPSLVIVGYVLNDPEIEPWQPLHRFYRETDHWWERLRLVELVQNVLRTRRMQRHGSDYYEYLHDPDGSNWPSVPEAFADMHEATRDRGLPLLLIIFPVTKDAAWSEYAYGDLHRQVAQAATESQFEVIDLLGVYSEHEPLPLMVRPNDPHPSLLGHEVIAQAILDWLQQSGRLSELAERNAPGDTDGEARD